VYLVQIKTKMQLYCSGTRHRLGPHESEGPQSTSPYMDNQQQRQFFKRSRAIPAKSLLFQGVLKEGESSGHQSVVSG